MTVFLTILLGFTMLAVVGVLGAGVLGMIRGGDPRRSNVLMRWRVVLQAAAVGIFVLLLTLWKRG